MSYVLYTYQTVSGALQCHVYGVSEDKDALEQIGESLQKSSPGLGFMVLELEALPASG